MSQVVLTKELLRDEAINILRVLLDNLAAGRSNRLADVKESMEAQVAVDFDDYFLFLRKHNYITLDREHGVLEVTTEGKDALGGQTEKLLSSVEEFFQGRLGDELDESFTADHAQTEIRRNVPPPPPPPVPFDTDARPAHAGPPPPPPPLQLVAPVANPRSPFDQQPSPHGAARPDQPPVLTKEAAGGNKEPRGTELDLRYTKYDPIGGGALGTVYRGKYAALGIEVAIKELRDIFGYFSFLQRGEVIKRLKKEICAQAQVRHPGILQILDQNTEVARPYFVMELAPGGNLRQKLDALGGKPLAAPQALRYFLQIVYALRASHQAGLFHQNLKPENILFDGLGNAKLSDFGLTRVVDTDSVAKQMPQVFLGTGGMGYLPPELLSGKKDFGPEGDLYMLGLLLYEMLTGMLPGRRSPLPSQANPQSPVKLDPIFDKLTQDKREARYPSVDALLDDFYAAFSDGRFLKKGDLLLYAQPADQAAESAEPEEAAKKSAAKKT